MNDLPGLFQNLCAIIAVAMFVVALGIIGGAL
jgi:hypothetical protein